MFRAHNIANALTHISGTIQTPLLRRGWGCVFLLTAILLLAWPRYAHAQNSSTAPYINSWHLYRVEMGNTANTVTWELYDNLGEAADHTLSGTGAWWDAAIVGDNAEIEIKFTNTEFASGQTWYLVYTETNIATGTCEARRIAPDILITDNEFFLSTQASDFGCNSWTNGVWDNTDDLTTDRDGSVTYAVEMHRNTNHLVREWSFDGEITINMGSGYSIPAAAQFITVTTGNSTYGDYTISGVSGGSFTVTIDNINTSDPAYLADTGDEVTFEINISGPAINDVEVTLTISNGQGISGTNYDVVTDDNGTGSNAQIRTLWGIPNTSVVYVSP